MTLTILMRASDGFTGGSGEYVASVYEGVPQAVGRDIVREFVAFRRGEEERTTRKEYCLPSGTKETIVLDYEAVVLITAFTESEKEGDA